ncbi:hypothetical protein IB211_02127c [Intestinimonas butyriciproducens]|uniref:Uncharacterized protein n=1 Tax=Intestinimonas butyriciproducens TaxID=1297617 RepID=A0A0S2W573_9FIRM|nr:hypothetical protein IB211_02127c [Intestinimonas butyriciproducens]
MPQFNATLYFCLFSVSKKGKEVNRQPLKNVKKVSRKYYIFTQQDTADYYMLKAIKGENRGFLPL